MTSRDAMAADLRVDLGALRSLAVTVLKAHTDAVGLCPVSWVRWRRQRACPYAGKHRRAVRARRRDHVTPIVEARALTAHFLTDEAFAADRLDGRCVALCGADVLPPPPTVAEAHHCSGCVALWPAGRCPTGTRTCTC
jgi:hypothetical protein